jgi:hypothetical protein
MRDVMQLCGKEVHIAWCPCGARWIEFADKAVAKRLARSLNGTELGGKHFSTHRYDLWNLKYLKHFKWDNLTAEIGASLRRLQKALHEARVVHRRTGPLSRTVPFRGPRRCPGSLCS